MGIRQRRQSLHGRQSKHKYEFRLCFKTYVKTSTGSTNALIVADGQVGIGTTPTEKLDVAGTTKTTSLQITSGAVNGFILKSDATGNASWINANTLPITENDPKVGTLSSNKIPKWNGTALADGLLFDDGTNIGIGTTTPSRKLTVVNPLSVGIAQLSGTSSARTSIGIGREDIEGTLNIAANTNEFFVGAAPGDIMLRTETTGQRLVLNSGTEAAALTVFNGNVGVGTISPANRLSVSGNLDISGNLGIGTATPLRKLTVVNPLSVGIAQLSGTSSARTSIGIGREDIEGTLNIAANSNEFFIGAAPGDIVLRTETTGQRLVLNSGTGAAALTVLNGNVGVGTVTPAQKLDVSGTTKTTNLQITSGATNGFILKSDASGNASWVNAITTFTENDPKVGTLSSNKIPKWNGTALADGLLFDDGTNIGIGTTTPSRKLTVVNPLSVGIAQLSGTSSAKTSIGIGRADIEGTLNIAANSNEFFSGAAPGDIELRTETTGQRLVLNSGGGAAALTVLNGNVGVGSISPTTTLDVNGGIKTKYSGTAVVIVAPATTTPYQIVIPALPAGWDYTNTVVLLSAADGAQGYIKQVKLTSTSSIDIYFEALGAGGPVRFNWIIFKM